MLQILLKLLVVVKEPMVRLQVRQCLVQLAHKHLVVSLAKVAVIVATELIVAVYHVSDLTHHPLNSVHWADSVSIAVHHGNRRQVDVLNRNVRRGSMLFSLDIILRVLLEAALDTHLKKVSKGSSRERLFFPNTLLLAPLTG